MRGRGSGDPEDKLVAAGLLLDTYGKLLTERQRTFMRLHFEEDLSFSDVAREFGISRQAVHDSVKHAMQTLRDLEKALRLVEKATTEPPAPEPHVGGRQLIERLGKLRERIQAECRSEAAAWIVAEFDELIDLLRGGKDKA